MVQVTAAGFQTMANRHDDLQRLYDILDRLEETLEGARCLADCSGRMDWPRRGVYFFREEGETRSDSGHGPRIARVGTHALKSGSGTSLWNRLSQHKGQASTGGGNHRGSIFRLIVGAAIARRRGYTCSTWGRGNTASSEVRKSEIVLEQQVTEYIGRMPFLWVAVDDAPGPESLRGTIERNAIGLLSNHGKSLLDPPSKDWLGHDSDRDRVRSSGLWNQNHVDEAYDPQFLDTLDQLVRKMTRPE